MRALVLLLTIVAALLGAKSGFAADPPATRAEPPTFRLPAGARPTRYALTLTVVPGEAKAAGEIAIDVELDRPHDVLWLNADSVDRHARRRSRVPRRASRSSAATSSSWESRSSRRCPPAGIA